MQGSLQEMQFKSFYKNNGVRNTVFLHLLKHSPSLRGNSDFLNLPPAGRKAQGCPK